MGKGSSTGSVYYLKSKRRWITQYFEFDYEKNKTIPRRKSFKNEEEAKLYLESIMYQKSNPIYIKHNGIPLIELMKAQERFKLDTNQISESQFMRVFETIKRIEKSDIAHTKINELSSYEIQKYFNSLKNLSNSYIDQIFGEFRRSYKYALRKGYIYKNPMDDVIKPKSYKEDKVVRALTFDEQQEFVKLLNSKTLKDAPLKNVFYIQMFMGLRVGEALALKSTDIDLEHNLLFVNKTLTKDKNGNPRIGNKTKTQAGIRKLPIPEFIKPFLIEQMRIAEGNKDKQLFLAKNGELVRNGSVNRVLKNLLSDLNIHHICTHSLRHTFGTRCIEAGMAPVVLQKLMGHTDITITLNTYTSVFNEYKEKEIDKVNQYFLNNNLLDNTLSLALPSESIA